ncbi:MAG: hypothetical protein KIT35_03125 [Piscinibacter sp.]|uniref:hypothetical protein n=1 Tax=Piscinibacter sp. TaxID=1903157 RepID=UPI00258FEFF5|nr:hypothetical protein [Piscinibacter sp.]MCW5662805.1 hypothetical protein [Piscinibacter sp.]
MAPHDERIAWLLTAEAIDITKDQTKAGLSEAAAAGFRAVAMRPSTGLGSFGQDLRARAMRLGMRCIFLDGESHHQLGAGSGSSSSRHALCTTAPRSRMTARRVIGRIIFRLRSRWNAGKLPSADVS